MNKYFSFYAVVAFSACLLVGCEKDKTEIPDCGIRFTVNSGNTFNICETPTRVTLYNNATDFKNSGVSFAVFGNNEDYSEELFKEKIVTKEGDYYKPSVDYVWDGTYINVYAVAPYISGSRPSTISNLKVITDPTDEYKGYLSFDYQALNSGIRVVASSLKDIMVGFNQNSHECSGSSKIVNINFYHVLSGMRFKAGSTLIGKTIKSISLIDFEAVGKFYVKISDSGVDSINFKGLILGGTGYEMYTNRYIYDNKYGVNGVTIASSDVGNEIGGDGNIIFLPPANLETDPPYYSRLRVIIEEDGKDLVYSKLFPTLTSQEKEKLKPSYIYDITIDIDDYKYTRTSTTDNPLRLSVTKTPME